MLIKKGLLIIVMVLISNISAFPSEWNNILRTTFTYGGTLNSNHFQQFGINLIADGISTARSDGFTGIRVDKLPHQVNQIIENELANYNLNVNDIFVFSVLSNRSLMHGTLRLVRRITGLSYEFYAVQIF